MARDFVSRFILKGDDQTARAFGQVERSAGRTIAKFAAFAGTGLAIDAVVDKTKEAIKQFDNIAKTADKIGIGTDALQELRHAFDLSGVAAEKTDKALSDFTRRLGELRTKTSSELSTALKDVDASLIDMLKSAGSTEEALNLMLEAIDKQPDAARRAALSYAAFGRSGVSLTNALRDGTKGIAEMRAEARELGIVIDEEALRASEELNDKLTIQQKIIDTQVKQAFVELGPIIVDATAAVAGMTKGVVDLVDKFRDLTDISTSSLDRKIERLEERIETTRRAIGAVPRELQEALDDLNAEKVRRDLMPAFEEFRDKAKAVRAIIGGIEFNRTFLEQIEIATNRIGQVLGLVDEPGPVQGETDAERRERERDAARLKRERELREAREKARIEAHRSDVDRIRERSEVFRAAQEGEIGMLRFRAAEEHEILREALDAKAIELEEFNAVRLRIEQDFQDQVLAIEERAAAARKRLEQQLIQQKIDAAMTLADSLIGISELAFGESKATAIADTFISTAAAVMRTLQVYGGTPWGYAAAAAVAALGAAQIAKIASTDRKSKGREAGGRSGGGAPSRAAAQALPPSTDTPRTPTVITLRLEGGRNRRYTFDEVVDMMEGFNEALGDGHKLHVTTG